MFGLCPIVYFRVPCKTSNKLLDQTHDTTWPYDNDFNAMKTHRIMTSKTQGPVDIEEDSGNPFEGFKKKKNDMQSRWV